MPPRKPSPVGAHCSSGGGLDYAREVGAEAIQLFTGNPRGWAQGPGDPGRDATFGAACAAARIPVFLHASYLVNLASPVEVTAERSANAVRQALVRGRRIGARGVVVHAGSAVDEGTRDAALTRVRERLLPILDAAAEGDPRILVEPTAGGGQPMCSSIGDLASYFGALDHHPNLGVCLDTCHAFAAGHDLAAPGGVRTMLNALLRAVGRGRLDLVHANDSKDPLGSARDRHQNIGAGTIGAQPFGELFRHPATSGVPVIVETPGDAATHARDVAVLKALRDR